MKNFLKQAFVCLGVILATHRGYCQTHVKLAGRNYVIPKFVDTAVKYSPLPPILERAKVLKPITASTDEVEIRVYYLGAFPMGPTSTLVLKGGAQKFTVDNIHYRFLRLFKDSLEHTEFKTFKDGNTPYRYTVKTITAPDTLYGSLIKNHLFDFDEKAIRDSLKKANVDVNDQEVYDGYIINVEIKVKDKYRMLRLDPIRYPLNVKELQPIVLLSKTFDDLLKLTK
jgi:hypothetical protein